MELDVAIIGAGLAGLSTAYHLSKISGVKIALLEQENIYSSHASGKNAGMLRQALDSKELLPLVQETLAALRSPPEDWEQSHCYRETGSLLLGTATRIQNLNRDLSAAGGCSKIFFPGEFPQGLDPQMRDWLASASYEAMLWSPGDGIVDVHALAGNFFRAARGRGVKWYPGWKVEQLSRESNGWELFSGKQKLHARWVVNAAGAWAGKLSAHAAVDSEEIQPFRRHLFFAKENFPASVPRPIVWHLDHEFYFRPETGGLLLSPGDEDPHPPGVPLSDPRAQELLAEKLTHHFPALEGLALQRGWACLRTKVRGAALKVGSDPSGSGWYWVAGLGGHGVSVSVGVGRRAAEEIARDTAKDSL